MCHHSNRQSRRPDYSFPKRDRLLLRSDFLVTTRRGRRYTSQYFLVFLRANRKGGTRLGITVSKKVGKAVDRNYLKRRVREFFRQHASCLPPSVDIVVVAKKGIPKVTYKMVCDDLAQCLERASVNESKRLRRKREHGKQIIHHHSKAL